MKKLSLFITAIFFCLFLSCKKDSGPITITAFTIDSLPIPFTIGTWWKYQRIDSVDLSLYAGSNYSPIHTKDTSIELITVIGKNTNTSVTEKMNKADSILLQVKNLTKGTLDTIYAFYFNPNSSNAYFIIGGAKDSINLFIKLPFVEGKNRILKPGTGFDFDDYSFIRDSSITIQNRVFDKCNYNEDYQYWYGTHKSNDYNVTSFLKPNIGFVFWEVKDVWYIEHMAPYTKIHSRSLIDYHLAL